MNSRTFRRTSCAARLTVLIVVAIFASACATRTILPTLDESHPASSVAAEAPVPPPSATLERGATDERSEPQRPPARTHNHGEEMGHASHRGAATYSCPMHPEVRQSSPGRCPKCGMTLVPQGNDEMPGGGHAH